MQPLLTQSPAWTRKEVASGHQAGERQHDENICMGTQRNSRRSVWRGSLLKWSFPKNDFGGVGTVRLKILSSVPGLWNSTQQKKLFVWLQQVCVYMVHIFTKNHFNFLIQNLFVVLKHSLSFPCIFFKISVVWQGRHYAPLCSQHMSPLRRELHAHFTKHAETCRGFPTKICTGRQERMPVLRIIQVMKWTHTNSQCYYIAVICVQSLLRIMGTPLELSCSRTGKSMALHKLYFILFGKFKLQIKGQVKLFQPGPYFLSN